MYICWAIICSISLPPFVLPQSEKQGGGTLCMYAVRNALSNPERLRANIEQILANGQAAPELLHADEDLSFIVKEGAAERITEAAYRFCSHTRGPKPS